MEAGQRSSAEEAEHSVLGEVGAVPGHAVGKRSDHNIERVPTGCMTMRREPSGVESGAGPEAFERVEDDVEPELELGRVVVSAVAISVATSTR